MVAFVLGFILPVVVWVLTLPLKLALRIMEKSVKYGTKKAIRAFRGVSNSEDDIVRSSKFKSASKTAKSVIKAGYAISKYSILITIRMMRLIITVLNMLIHFLIWLSSIASISYTVMIAGALVCVIVAITSAYSLLQTDTGAKADGPVETTTSTGTTEDFFSIDWSKNFSSQLGKIQDKYGVEARNWVELSVIEMNTMQKAMKDNKISNARPILTGIKAVETSQVSLSNKPDLTKQEVRASDGSTPMQFDTSWQKYNPYYTGYNRAKGGSPYYYPDCFYGIALRFNTAAVKGFIPRKTTPMYNKAFKTMGVSETTDKLRFVRYLTDTTNEYNSIYIFPNAEANDAVYANAMLMIEFGETYGYNVTDKTINLVKSMYSNGKKTKYSNWFYSKDRAIKAIYGMTGGSKSYPGDVDKTSNYGVITPDGKSVKGSLFNYLVSRMPSSAKSAMWSSRGLKYINATPTKYMRARYDLTAYLCGVYDVWWASNALGVSVEGNKGSTSDDSTILNNGDAIDNNSNNEIINNKLIGIDQKIVSLAEKYASDTSESRIQFGYTGVGTRQDSASFVNGVLRELGYGIDGTSLESRPLKVGNLTYVRTEGQMLEKVLKNKSELVKMDGYDGSKNIPINVLASNLKPGDILLSDDDDLKHTAIYVGTNKNGDNVVIESLTDNPNQFTAKSNINLEGKSYGFGFTNLDKSPNANKYNYIIRLSNIVGK